MWRRVISTGLALLLLFLPDISYAAGAGGDEALPDPPAVERPWDAPPQVTLAAVNISGAPETLELRMEVAGGSCFKSAGAVLRYDATKLKLISWDSQEEVLSAVNRCSDPAVGWTSGAAILPTKGPDDLSSKQSKGYLSEDGSEGYLYLAAESMLAQTFSEDRYVTAVRFAYVEGTTPTGGGITGGGITGGGITGGGITGGGITGGGITGGGVTEEGITDGGGAGSEVISVGAVIPGETIGFVGGGRDFAGLTDREKELLLHSPLGAKMEYGEENRANLATKLWYLSPLAATAGGLAVEHPGKTDNLLAYPGNVDFEVRETGESVNTGGGPANPDDFASIVLYDWDETLLGSIIIAKEAGETEIQKALDQFVSRRYAGYTEEITFPADLSQESYQPDPDKPLTYKKGYNFAGWVEVNGGAETESLEEAFTAYPELGVTPSAIVDGRPVYPEGTFNAAKWDYSQTPEGGWNNISLKAGYVENALCNVGGSNYTVLAPTYNRYGSASQTVGQYVLNLIFKRENTEGNGVTRLKSPAIRVSYVIDGVTLYSSVTLVNSDLTEGEVIVPRLASEVSATIIDLAEFANWVGASSKLLENVKNYDKKTEDGKEVGFIYQGTLAFLNEQGILEAQSSPDSDWASTNNILDFNDLKLDLSRQTEISSRFQLMAARNKLVLLYIGNGGQSVEPTAMQQAIELNAPGVNAANTFNEMKTKVKTAYETKGSALTILEIQAAIN